MLLPTSLIPPLYITETCNSAHDSCHVSKERDVDERVTSRETATQEGSGNAAPAEEIVVTMESNDNFTNMTVKQLREECKSRDLDYGGNKKDLVNRLKENS
jgi:hypothetical protein